MSYMDRLDEQLILTRGSKNEVGEARGTSFVEQAEKIVWSFTWLDSNLTS